MAYKLAKTGVQANVQIREYICDTVDDIATLPDSDPFGSKVFVIETSETYVKSSDGEYVKTTSGGGGGGITPHGVINITTNGDHDVTEKATARVNVPIPPGYVIPTGSVDITANGQVPVSGKATANVNVPQGVFPSGTKVITENVTGEDVTNYAAVDVAVPGPSGTKQISITANGTTTENVTDYANAEIAVNTLPAKGLVFEDYDSDGYPHSARFVGAWTAIPDRWFGSYFQKHVNTSTFNRYLYKIATLVFPEGISSIGTYAFENCSSLENVTFPTTLTTLKCGSFYGQSSIQSFFFPGDVTIERSFSSAATLKTVVFGAQCVRIGADSFYGTNNLELVDFSHCTTIPPLYSVNSLQHKAGCVIRIPAALSDTTLGTGNGWESATNWSALNNIVWEVV